MGSPQHTPKSGVDLAHSTAFHVVVIGVGCIYQEWSRVWHTQLLFASFFLTCLNENVLVLICLCLLEKANILERKNNSSSQFLTEADGSKNRWNCLATCQARSGVCHTQFYPHVNISEVHCNLSPLRGKRVYRNRTLHSSTPEWRMPKIQLHSLNGPVSDTGVGSSCCQGLFFFAFLDNRVGYYCQKSWLSIVRCHIQATR